MPPVDAVRGGDWPTHQKLDAKRSGSSHGASWCRPPTRYAAAANAAGIPIASVRLGQAAPTAIASQPWRRARTPTPSTPPASRPSGRSSPNAALASASATKTAAQKTATSRPTAAPFAHCVATTHGVREHELQASGVLLAREGSGPRADPERERQERQHQAEELGIDEPSTLGDVDAPGETEEGPDRFGVALEEIAEPRRALDRRKDRSETTT